MTHTLACDLRSTGAHPSPSTGQGGRAAVVLNKSAAFEAAIITCLHQVLVGASCHKSCDPLHNYVCVSGDSLGRRLFAVRARALSRVHFYYTRRAAGKCSIDACNLGTPRALRAPPASAQCPAGGRAVPGWHRPAPKQTPLLACCPLNECVPVAPSSRASISAATTTAFWRLYTLLRSFHACYQRSLQFALLPVRATASHLLRNRQRVAIVDRRHCTHNRRACE